MDKIIAVDFDGCLVANRYPDIGEPINETIVAVLQEQYRGAKIILWTCRSGGLLDDAVAWCEGRGIRLAAANRNLPETIAAFGGDTRKIHADAYWDDKARRMPCKWPPGQEGGGAEYGGEDMRGVPVALPRR